MALIFGIQRDPDIDRTVNRTEGHGIQQLQLRRQLTDQTAECTVFHRICVVRLICNTEDKVFKPSVFLEPADKRRKHLCHVAVAFKAHRLHAVDQDRGFMPAAAETETPVELLITERHRLCKECLHGIKVDLPFVAAKLLCAGTGTVKHVLTHTAEHLQILRIQIVKFRCSHCHIVIAADTAAVVTDKHRQRFIRDNNRRDLNGHGNHNIADRNAALSDPDFSIGGDPFRQIQCAGTALTDSQRTAAGLDAVVEVIRRAAFGHVRGRIVFVQPVVALDIDGDHFVKLGIPAGGRDVQCLALNAGKMDLRTGI